MDDAVTILYIILVIMFILGLIISFLAAWFNKHNRHPVLTILLSVLISPLIYIPLTFILGFIARPTIIFILTYSIAMIILAVKNKKEESDKKV